MSTILDALRKLESERRGDEDPVYRNISAGAGNIPVRSGLSLRSLVMLAAGAVGVALLAVGYFGMTGPRDGPAESPAGSSAEARVAGTGMTVPSESLPAAGAVPAPAPRPSIGRRPDRGETPGAVVVQPEFSESGGHPADRRAAAAARAESASARPAARSSAPDGQPTGAMPGDSGPLLRKRVEPGRSTGRSASAAARPGTVEPMLATAGVGTVEPEASTAVLLATPGEPAPPTSQPALTAEPEPAKVADAVPTAPEPLIAAESVPTTPAPMIAAEPVPVAPEPATAAEPVPTTPAPVIAAEPVPVTPEPATAAEPVPMVPQPVTTAAPSRAEVVNLRWHPSAERRLVRIRIDDSGPYDLHEGDVIAGVLIYRIHPASVEVREGNQTKMLTLGD